MRYNSKREKFNFRERDKASTLGKKKRCFNVREKKKMLQHMGKREFECQRRREREQWPCRDV
jgi:hypothetical protein